ncbi:MAG: amidohydrolase family protein [Dehalococcoidia bacterium]
MPALAITNGRLFDATGAEPIEPANVVIEDGRISAAGPAATVQVPDGAETIDASGKFVMPGLTDMHVHVVMSGGQDSLYSFLGAGVTTVRDLGGDPQATLQLRDEVASGERVGPRMFVHGPFIEGDPPVFAARTRQQRPVATADALTTAMWPHGNADDIRETVDNVLARGVDGIKLYAGLRPDLVEAAIEAVDGRVFVTGHLGRTWASEAIAAGINGLEHVHATLYQDVALPEDRHEREGGNGAMPNYWSWLTEGWSRADLKAGYVRELIESIVERRVVLSPTLVLVTNGMATTEARDEPGLKYLPKAQAERRRETEAMRERMRQEAEAEGREMPPLAGVDPAVGERALANQLEFVAMVHRAGGLVLPSTDVGPTPCPGFSLHRELSLHTRAGISNVDVLQNATRVAAEVLGRGDDLGTVEAGKIADLIVLDGDPLANIDATRSVSTVVKDGIAYEPQQILDRIETE